MPNASGRQRSAVDSGTDAAIKIPDPATPVPQGTTGYTVSISAASEEISALVMGFLPGWAG